MILSSTPIEEIPRTSKRIVPALKKLGIKTIRDLFYHFPSRYQDFSQEKPISEVNIGETVTIRGKIISIGNSRTPRKRLVITQALVGDESGAIKTMWFNQPFLLRNLKTGMLINMSGKIAQGPQGKYLQNPAYEKIGKTPGVHTGGLIPIYPETKGITSRWLRFLINFHLHIASNFVDPLPPEIRKKFNLPELKDALAKIHFPKTYQEAERAQKRFNFEELMLIQLRVLKERLLIQEKRARAISLNLPLIKKFVQSLPFKLTDAQRRSIWEILNDLAKPRPMNRLLEGDVGSGKTVVAAAAALNCAASGFKTAFMAPTEILARQHYRTLQKVLAPFGFKIGLLTGSEKKVTPDMKIIVGTHALIQKNVRIENLGLVILDEQHKFGVEQRAELLKTQIPNTMLRPHLLSMSATPIPRTIALTIFGDLDLSVLDEMPKNRKEIITRIVEPGERANAYQFVRDEVKRGRQIFVICPRIETPEEKQGLVPTQQKLFQAEAKAVKAEFEKLREKIFPDLGVGMLHGKMKPKEKENVMRRYQKKDINILVSTSVVEVGVDIPNATIMLIEDAQKFGLAQLHQFRGRVGRGNDQSYCFLMVGENGAISQRLQAVVESKNGFELAEKDFKIRGPGDVFGTRQWGIPNHIFSALADAKLVKETRDTAIEIIKTDPLFRKHPLLKHKLKEKEKTFHRE